MALPTYKAFLANLEPTTLPPEASEDECEICYFPFTEPIRLPCSHVFCKKCLVRSVIPRNFCSKCRHILFEKRPFDHTKDEGRYDERTPVPERPRRPASALIRALSGVAETLDAERRERQAAFPAEAESSLAERPRRSALPRPPRVTESLFDIPAAPRMSLAERRETPSSMFAGMFDQLTDDIPGPSPSGSMPPQPPRASERLFDRPARVDWMNMRMSDIEAGPRASGPVPASSPSGRPRRPRRSERTFPRPAALQPHLEERSERLSMFDIDAEPRASVPRPSGRRMLSSYGHKRRASRARSSLAIAAGEEPGAGAEPRAGEGPAAGGGPRPGEGLAAGEEAAGEEEPGEAGQGGTSS